MCDFKIMALDDAAMVDRLLNTFGSSILDLRIDFSPYAVDAVTIVDLILHNCTELESLTMQSYNIPDCQDEFKKMRQLFGKLKSLHILEVWIEGCEEWDVQVINVTRNGNVINFFGECHSLVDLQIENCFVLERAIFDSQLPKLKHFHYKCYSDHLVEGVRAFVFRHCDLKTLILGYNIDITGTIEVISANCTKLEELEFGTDEDPPETSLRQLGKLQYLTKLKIHWHGLNVIGLLKEFQRSTSLEVLKLNLTLGSHDLIPTIANIKSLRVLKLNYNQSLQNLRALRDLTQLVELYISNLNIREFDFDLVDIIQRLADLKKFKFDLRGYRISKNIYHQLVNIVENRPVVENRYMELHCRTTEDFEDLLRPSVELKKVHFF